MGVRGTILLCLALTASAAPAHAYVPEKTPRRAAGAAAFRMLEQPPARGTLAGVIVMRGGRMLFSTNADEPMAPASLMKLLTTTTAAMVFGTSRRFATRALTDTRNNVLALIGGGDPTFSTEAYRRYRFEPKPSDRVRRPAFAHRSPTVEDLADRIAATGIHSFAGDLVADESLFDTVRTQRGWLARYLGRDPDTGLLTALALNEGKAGRQGRTLLPDQALSAGQALKAALAARHISIAGTVRVARAPARMHEIARVESPPLSEMIDFINRYSINFHAELLLKSLGAASGGAGTTLAGVSVVRAQMRRLGVGVPALQMQDGSGLSILNRVTPRTLGVLLFRILTGKGAAFEALRASLPVAGRPGTLENRMTRPPTVGNLRGKTGQISFVRGMAGWVTAADGVPVVYVALFNHVPRPMQLTEPLNLFGELLARLPQS